MGSMQVAQKKEPVPAPGPPFVATSADNGLSVNTAGAGEIVLGNDQGDAAMPARLLNNREISTSNGNELHFVDTVPANTDLTLFDQRVRLTNLLSGAVIFMELNGSSPQWQANAPVGNDANFSISNPNSGVSGQTNGLTPFVSWSNPTTGVTDFRAMLVLGVLRIRDNNGTGNGLNINGTANDVASTGTISTANPLSGAGKWKLGTVVAGAVAADAANYVEVDIGGSIVKLIKAV